MIYNTEILSSVEKASELLLNGKIIVYPTDTLYGFGVDATNTESIIKLNKLKQREQAYSIIVDSLSMLKNYAQLSVDIEDKIKSMLPGPITVILNQLNSNLSYLVNPGLKTIGVRIPNNQFILNVVKKINKPIITTSVNIHSEKPLNNIDLINEKFSKIDIFKNSSLIQSKGSTIIDFSKTPFKIIRQGDQKIIL